MAPTPHLVSASVLRLYVGLCDAQMTSRIGWVDVDADDPARVLSAAEAPVLDIGEPGAFDDSGVVPTAIVPSRERLLLYYAGFQRGTKVPYTIFTGLAVSSDGGHNFLRHERVPILDRTSQEPTWRTAAHVVDENGIFRMWYAGGGEWIDLGGKKVPRLDIRHIDSPDGIAWRGPITTCLAVDSKTEVSLGRPWVVRESNHYAMYYSIRGGAMPYRLATATSTDGLIWTQESDEPGLALGPEPWDLEMMYASSVFRRGEREYLFYNGNGTGATGVGWAERSRA